MVLLYKYLYPRKPIKPSDMIRILIIDDENAAVKMLRLLIDKYIQHEKVIKICLSAEEALRVIPVYKPTLLMLDVEMPGMNGFDLLDKMPEWNFDIIFTTAYDKYAIKAIRFSVLDYLLKPIDVAELQDAIYKHIVKQKTQPFISPQLVKNLIHNLRQGSSADFKLALSTNKGVFFIAPSEIVRCEGDDNYSHFYFISEKPIVVARTLKEYDEILQDHGFIRIHRSHLVNIKHISQVDKAGNICLKNGEILPVSRRRKNDVLRELSRYSR